MKKMNFRFWRLGTKMVLPLFLLAGLFLMSAVSANAQYISKSEAKEALEKHLSELPPRKASFLAVGHAMTPRMEEESMNSLRHRFGQSILRKIVNGLEVSEAIDQTYNGVKGRIEEYGSPEMLQYLDRVKSEYVDLLSE